MEPEMKATNEYRSMAVDAVMKALKGNTGGLSEAEAAERLRKFGPNEIQEAKKNPVLQFLKRYWGPMPWLLEFAMALTIFVRHYTEAILIFVLLTVNAVIGFVQSRNSQKAVALLKKQLQIKTKVLRNGQWVLRDAKDLVPGDLLNLRLGDLVPADVYVLEGEVSVDASALTGESLPQDVSPAGVVYSGSIIKRGETKAMVVNTARNTYFGKTVSLVQIAKPTSKQQKIMFSIVKYMMYLGVAASAVVTCYALVIHKDLMSILSLIIVFLMGAIPVALPAVMTIVQAVGALNLSKRGVLVTRLDSLEDAASIDTFCFDKTGTITQNELSVTDCAAFGSFHKDEAIRFAALASKAEEMDAIDTAILHYAQTEKVDAEQCRQLSYLPFSPANKRTEATAEIGGVKFRIFKGAPQIILKLCAGIEPQMKKAVNDAVDAYSTRGYRTIAVAVRQGEEDGAACKFVGLLALSDPPREDSGEMIREIQKLGIRTLMLTGDNQAIAREIAGQVGIGTRIHSAKELDGLSHDEQVKLIDNCDGFAEVYPEDKFKIVQLLQTEGHMVGMTGDGVNDSPALKQAELGTAVSAATDVAKASASVVLTKPGLSEIINTIDVSRQTYQRMLTWVINKITKVVEVVVLFTAGFFWMHNMLISLLGMSLLVFANDFVTMTIASDNVRSTRTPNSWKMKSIISASLCLGVLFALEDLLVAYIGVSYFHLNYEMLCTLVMLSLVFNTQFRILIVRERQHFWSSVPSGKLLGISLLAIVAFALLGVLGDLVPALAWQQVAILLGIGVCFMVLVDFVKYGLFRLFHV
ncbi:MULTISPECIES: plasma-membrane proton-efflux P-type ATPase [Caproicibacterium]|uniref:Plasma-membrane proton-efflux P-type ATPase n=1 Tax=Caproicibacterium argilliputei TaxID=3030016 RepID=A0AA97D8Q5_9FIRM|nr:plasma-membrane proton-efflux P-type ATPase [Caproicibacterium argilliputei]WOC31752.1 plasma-membrane proton-efflux P-type ATPase [Caproicibacterium argilliputei]